MPDPLLPPDVFTAAPGPLAVADRAGTLRRVNPAFAAALDADPAALAGRALADLADPADREAVTQALTTPHPAGTHRFGGRTVAWRATPGPTPDALVLAAWDVSALRAETDGLAADLDALISAIGHDLRAPLRAIDGLAGVLLGDAHADALPADTRRFLGLLREASGDMAARFDALLAVARAAREPLHARDGVDVAGVAREIIDYVLAPRVGERDITWIVGDDLPAARADPALLRRLLEALLEDALKSSADAATIELAYDVARRAYVIRHDGPARDPDAGAPTNAGLAIAARIAARHGGRVRAGTAPGDGAAVFFTLAAPPA